MKINKNIAGCERLQSCLFGACVPHPGNKNSSGFMSPVVGRGRYWCKQTERIYTLCRAAFSGADFLCKRINHSHSGRSREIQAFLGTESVFPFPPEYLSVAAPLCSVSETVPPTTSIYCNGLCASSGRYMCKLIWDSRTGDYTSNPAL